MSRGFPFAAGLPSCTWDCGVSLTDSPGLYPQGQVPPHREAKRPCQAVPPDTEISLCLFCSKMAQNDKPSLVP